MGCQEIGLNCFHCVADFRHNVMLTKNVAGDETNCLQRMAEFFLTPLSYLVGGESILIENRKIVEVRPNHHYNDSCVIIKTILAVIALPISLIIGSVLKGLSYLMCTSTRENYELISLYYHTNQKVDDNTNLYIEAGLLKAGETGTGLFSEDFAVTQGLPQGPLVKREQQQAQVEAMQEVFKILRENDIPCWIDCGTCLGFYRHGAIIPWDMDVDLAILQVDFANTLRVLRNLPERYRIQDWSGTDRPGTLLRVHIRGTGALIDIYCFGIISNSKEVQYISSHENSCIPQSCKETAESHLTPISFETIFPLKKAHFALVAGDGQTESEFTSQVWVPNDSKSYLEIKYGNIDPAKIWNPDLQQYERVPGHPYWDDAPDWESSTDKIQ